MTTQELLELDYRVEENQKIIQKALRKIFSDEPKIGEVPLIKLEIFISKFEKKNNLYVSYIIPTIAKDKNMYTARIVDKLNLKEVKQIYGICIYELFAKICIYYYSKNKKEMR